MRFARDFLITIVILVVVAAVIANASIGNFFSAASRPGRLESSLAIEARNLSIPAGAKSARNPYASDGNAWRDAADHFGDHCAVCHGKDGRGGGEIGPKLYPPAPDMTRSRTQSLTDGEIFYIVSNGVRWTGMPAWKNEHTPEETWRLVSFIRHLPSLTSSEIEQYEKAPEGEPHEEMHHRPGR